MGDGPIQVFKFHLEVSSLESRSGLCPLTIGPRVWNCAEIAEWPAHSIRDICRESTASLPRK